MRFSIFSLCVLLAFGLTACSKQTTTKQANTKTAQQTTQTVTSSYLDGWLQQSYASETDKVNDFFERVFNDDLRDNPERQSQLGLKSDNDKWDDISDNKALADKAKLELQLKNLRENIDFEQLDKQAQLSYRLFIDAAQQQLDNFKFRFHNYPINQMFGLQSAMPAFMLNMHKIDDLNDAKAYISRLNSVDTKFAQLLENLNIRQAKGILAPKFVYPYVINDSQNLLTGKPFDDSEHDNILLADFKKKIAKLPLDEAQLTDLIAQANQALLSSVKPAYESLIASAKQLQATATEDDGAWKFPDGEAFYNAALKSTTTTTLTADEIHNIGLAEVVRIHAEMLKIKDKVGFEGDLQQFFQFMRTDRRFYKDNTDAGRAEYLAENVAVIELMKSKLNSLFLTLPKADIEVKAVEKFREKSAGKAFYNRPSMDGTRPGIYYANLYNMDDMPTYQMQALAHHEGIPGHHMQLAIAQELQDIPKFRKFGGYTAYIEGWGLYSEFLAKQVGAYQDPYSDFGRLAMELWRSCRLVVDTGIHAKKWTRQQGIDYYVKNTPNPAADAVKMVERHIVMPSQATAYKIGMLKILELRQHAIDVLGQDFDIREFHDAVLTNGAVPLNILQQLVDEWIQSKQ